MSEKIDVEKKAVDYVQGLRQNDRPLEGKLDYSKGRPLKPLEKASETVDPILEQAKAIQKAGDKRMLWQIVEVLREDIRKARSQK